MEPTPPGPLDLTRTCGGMVLGIIAVLVFALNAVEGYPDSIFGTCNGLCGCYACSANGTPQAPPWKPPVWTFMQTYPILSAALLAASVLLSVVGFIIARSVRRTPGASSRLKRLPAFALMLQISPIITVTLMALVALFLFPTRL